MMVFCGSDEMMRQLQLFSRSAGKGSKCLTTSILIASHQKSGTLLQDELLPAPRIAHVDRGIRVEHQAALLPRFVEIERHAGVIRFCET